MSRFRLNQIVIVKARVVAIRSPHQCGYPDSAGSVIECNIIDRNNNPVDPMYFHYFAEDQVRDMQEVIRAIRGTA